MAVLITGVAGFIGSNLASHFLNQGKKVFGVDNFARGTESNLAQIISNSNFYFKKVDISRINDYRIVFDKFIVHDVIAEVWHMAANSDILAGAEDPDIDLRDTFMTTFNTVKLMKDYGIKILSFASSSAIYGDFGSQLIEETSGPLLPISNYGAMKLASEAIISAAVESHLDQVYIFRFPNVVGTPATHGVILDFVRSLKKSLSKLAVLGNGSQQKGYIHVEELLDAMFFIRSNANEKIAIFNIGAEDVGVTVKSIAEEVVASFYPKAEIVFGVGNKGWIGDVPIFIYSTKKLKNLGWISQLNSKQAIQKAISQIIQQEANSK
ncbi:MAG: NAD-dependent epimerase/dehydratase family protein [bacterium]